MKRGPQRGITAAAFTIASERYLAIEQLLLKSVSIDDLLGFLGANETSQIIDVGCGPGGLTIELAKSIEYIWGIDISGRMIDFARKNRGLNRAKFRKLNQNIDQKVDFMVHCHHSFDETLHRHSLPRFRCLR